MPFFTDNAVVPIGGFEVKFYFFVAFFYDHVERLASRALRGFQDRLDLLQRCANRIAIIASRRPHDGQDCVLLGDCHLDRRAASHLGPACFCFGR